MKYSQEFIDLLDQTHVKYIGHGNPNAKILFIGQEPAIDRVIQSQDFIRDIESNAEQWRAIVSNYTGYELVNNSKIEFGLPLHPWANQKFQVRCEMQNGVIRGEEGTSRTWYNYQKLVNKIFECYSNERKPMTKENNLDFHKLSFHTDMSSSALKHHSNTIEGEKSVKERMSLLSNEFFRRFPIVIAAVGHFPRDSYGDSYFGHLFGVNFLRTVNSASRKWFNISIGNSETAPMLLIHTLQLSAAISDQYLDQIAGCVVEFANDHQINLLPDY